MHLENPKKKEEKGMYKVKMSELKTHVLGSKMSDELVVCQS